MSINAPFWTLTPIFQFYLVFPLLFEAGRRWGWGWLVLGSLVLATAWRAFVTHEQVGMEHLKLGVLLGTLPEFCFGMAVAFWYNNRPGPLANQAPESNASLRYLGIATPLLGLAIGLREWNPTLDTSFLLAAGYAWLTAAILLSADRQGPLARGASHRVLVWLGMISFSLYLNHSFVLIKLIQVYQKTSVCSYFWDDILFVPLSIAISLGFAWGFYRLVERPLTTSRSLKPKRAPCH
ncbi:hypothetical protein BH23PLA1_BH23PLA1_41570 [soil metagenome]